MRITCTRTGGLAGLAPPPVTLDTAGMEPGESARWKARVLDAGFFDLPARLRSGRAQPDRFHYTITVEQDDGPSHTVAASEEALPEPLRRLVEALQELARGSGL